MRRRAGNAWTAILRKGRLTWVMMDSAGNWISTGRAAGWPRCQRCRKPIEHAEFSALHGKCHHCHYYTMAGDEFWSHEADYFFPYNIGERCMRFEHTPEAAFQMTSDARPRHP